MRTVVPLGLTPSPSRSSSSSIAAKTPIHLLRTPSESPSRVKLFQKCVRGVSPPRFSDHVINSRAGTCRASQAVDLFPSICPEIVVRDARIEDCWEVADTHCSSFFPNYTFPIDLVLRIERFVALLSGLSIPPGCMGTCLVAVTGATRNDNLYIGSKYLKIGGLDGKFNISRESVAGILTVDTLADYLPRKGPLRQRRTGIAYISNVAVRKADRRKGIAKLLLAKAEGRALSWGCRSIALHCDVNNTAAVRLYKSEGFKIITLPDDCRWPQPKTAPNIQFYLMMKLLSSKASI
ncbi:uncharacterized protein LOC110023956 [Phalaenopsis equestris]|uniref:uncharacterized protein LOC110023956 n=1 Tax=Phalaenopsis equestris TaxID=78828 RepID=UPI0009E39EB9|nr:uncharacterized protein LOC110023956 [Phalaenopsis equestris]